MTVKILRSLKRKIYVLSVVVFTTLLSHSAFAALPAELSTAADQIYNANFLQANAAISSYIASHPQDPAGFLLRGMLGEWDQVVNNKKRALNGQILADYQKANELAQAAFDADPENTDKMVMLGNTHMYIAKKLVDNGQKMRGGFALKNAKELMLNAIEKDPNNYDAYMALGVFNYFSDNVPSGFKWLASLLGFNGTRAKGLEYLRKAAENRNLTQGDAAFLLVYIYEDKEKNYPTAIVYNEILKKRYPNNPAYQYETGELQHRQKNYATARATLNQFLSFCDSKPKGFCNDKYKFLAHYFLAWGNMEEKKYADAKKHLAIAQKLNEHQYKDRDVDMDLWAGLIAKSDGKNKEAEEYFRKVEANQKANPKAWQTAQQQLDMLTSNDGREVAKKKKSKRAKK